MKLNPATWPLFVLLAAVAACSKAGAADPESEKEVQPTATVAGVSVGKGTIAALCALGVVGYVLYNHPPLQTVGRGETGIRVNQLTGDLSEWRDGDIVRMGDTLLEVAAQPPGAPPDDGTLIGRSAAYVGVLDR